MEAFYEQLTVIHLRVAFHFKEMVLTTTCVVLGGRLTQRKSLFSKTSSTSSKRGRTQNAYGGKLRHCCIPHASTFLHQVASPSLDTLTIVRPPELVELHRIYIRRKADIGVSIDISIAFKNLVQCTHENIIRSRGVRSKQLGFCGSIFEV